MHGRIFGGLQYISHVGRGGSAFLQGALILSALLLALAPSAKSADAKAMASLVVVLSGTFILTLVGGSSIPLLRSLLIFVSPYSYPTEGFFIHGLVFLSALATLASQFTGTNDA